MKNHFDTAMKKKIRLEQIEIPDSYFKRVNLTLQQLPEKKSCAAKTGKWKLKYAAAAAACICLIVSGTVYATVNFVQQRMQSMNEAEKEKIVDFTNASPNDADAFSRELTDEEKERMELLLQAYQLQGVFPEQELPVVENKDLAESDTVAFAAEESMFLLPERTLTDEELLQIIDFYFRRDYSLRTSGAPAASPSSVTDTKVLDRAESLAKDAIRRLYGIETEDLETSVEDTGNGTCHIELTGPESERYRALYHLESDRITEAGLVSGADASGSGLVSDADTSGSGQAWPDEEHFAEIGEGLMDTIYELVPGASISEIYCDYHITEEGTLAREIISYLYVLENGESCVVKYEPAKDLVTDLLIVSYQAYQQTLDENAARLTERGITRVRIDVAAETGDADLGGGSDVSMENADFESGTDETALETEAEQIQSRIQEQPAADTESAEQIIQSRQEVNPASSTEDLEMKLKPSTLSQDSLGSVTVTITNHSSCAVTASDAYILQRYNGTDWEQLPLAIAFHDLGISIPSGQSYDFTYNLGGVYAFESGAAYRIVKNVYLNQKPYTLHADFTVE